MPLATSSINLARHALEELLLKRGRVCFGGFRPEVKGIDLKLWGFDLTNKTLALSLFFRV